MLADGLLDTLPVGAAVPDLLRALDEAGTAVLQAPPGTGKTTLVPLALADHLSGRAPGRVVVAEPRRVAARAAAARMASLLGEPVGETVGYAVRGERRSGPRTRVEVVTTGLLLRRMLHDPELPGVGALLLDEVHERQLDADLVLAFALQARELLREDLRLVAASATLDVPRLAQLLGGPVVTATAPVHPLEVRWCPPPRPVRPPEGLRVDPALLDHVAALVRRALTELTGDVLVFLPGAGEIRAVEGRLSGPGADVDVVPLHGRRSGAEQDAALRPGPRRRVVLSTAVAESSLTVPGVRVVVDAGLSRVPRIDHARGFGGLDTVRVSRASADQRAGRAARQGPGTVLRAWSQAEHALLAAHSAPEVLTADLTGFALLTAGWGEVDDLALLDAPPAGPLAAAREALTRLGALDGGAITPLGRRMADVGLHPRLARALLQGAERVGSRAAAEVVALLSEDSARSGDDLVAAWRSVSRDASREGSGTWRREVARLLAAAGEHRGTGAPRDLVAGTVVALAHPERVARQRSAGGTAYATAGGTGVELDAGSGLRQARWLAVAVADRAPGRAAARVRAAAPLDEDTARDVVGVEVVEEVRWDGDVRARRVERLGALELSARPLPDPPADAVAEAVAEGVRREGLGLLTFGPAAASLRARVACCRAAQGDPWPDLGDEHLLATLPRWLDLGGVRSRRDLARLDVAGALRALLPWPQAGRLDELAPLELPVPTGRSVRVDYSDPALPVVALKLQEAFGWTATPRLVEGRVRVVLHLLSPAGRPLAVTSDLASFWRGAYPSVRAEMRGRYPRHPWPEDPFTAAPTARTTRRSG
ncbi:ATP-dependent helicase HrpB [Kineococcus rhizosphaerae]|uniref:RNA helicase n=1 Tax=Kineococcus rhizosphaerae TaxID=559628 RepID=A0A2T0QZ60_9ACTN|nr:ATP-dependent helicase HrpB [Kineococcus rhizosphaerae]PRY11736.1 ATP-dependent helicase HrpB [Kineococcus rhizosphaerae]